MAPGILHTNKIRTYIYGVKNLGTILLLNCIMFCLFTRKNAPKIVVNFFSLCSNPRVRRRRGGRTTSRSRESLSINSGREIPSVSEADEDVEDEINELHRNIISSIECNGCLYVV